MTSKPKQFGAFRQWTRNQYGHTTRGVTIFSCCDVASVEKLFAGAVDNRAGYGTMDAANNVRRLCEQLLDVKIFEIPYPGTWSGVAVRIEFLVYNAASDDKPEVYCDPTIKHRAQLSAFVKSGEFVKKLLDSARKAENNLRTPQELCDLLRAKKYREIVRNPRAHSMAYNEIFVEDLPKLQG